MNFYEALNIFELNSNYTKEELDKKYYTLAKKYHPDTLANKPAEEQTSSAEMLKKINEARDILSKNLKERKSTQYRPSYSSYTTYQNRNNNIGLKEHKEKILNIIEKNRYINHKIRNEFMGSIFNFESFVTKYRAYIANAECIDLVDNFFARYKKELKVWYNTFKKIYFNRYLIPKSFEFEIDTNLSLDEFYEKLENIKEESIKVLYAKEVDDIITPFKSNKYYKDLKSEIENLRNEAVENILNIDSSLYDYKTNEKYYLDKLKMDIEILFKRISFSKPLYLNLLSLIYERHLPFDLENLKKSLTDYLFPIYYQELKDDVKHYLELDEYYEEILNITNGLTSRYHAALNRSDDPNFKSQITKLYHKIKNFLAKDHNINIESLRFLNKIDFTNYEEDVRIFDKVVNNIMTLKNVEIYLCNSVEIPEIQVKIDNEEYVLLHINNENVVYKDTNVDGNKMSLDAFMDNASALFLKFVYNNEEFIGLYRFNNVILCLHNGHLEFLSDIELINIETFNMNKIGRYKSKDYVKGLLINQYYQYIELCKKEKKILNLNDVENNNLNINRK